MRFGKFIAKKTEKSSSFRRWSSKTILINHKITHFKLKMRLSYKKRSSYKKFRKILRIVRFVIWNKSQRNTHRERENVRDRQNEWKKWTGCVVEFRFQANGISFIVTLLPTNFEHFLKFINGTITLLFYSITTTTAMAVVVANLQTQSHNSRVYLIKSF